MAVIWGSEIVKSGLVLYLDAGNQNSYPGTGTTWFDLSGGGLNASGGASSITSNGVTSGASWSTASTSILNTNTHSIFFMFKINSTGTYPNGWSGGWDKVFSYNAPGSDRSPGVWRYPSERRIHWRYDPGNTGIDFYSNASGTPFDLNVWYHIGVTKNNASALAYVNGVNVASATVANPKTSGNAAVIINEGYTSQLNNVNCVMIYNRVLSSTEIQQNYNATKSRFPIPDGTISNPFLSPLQAQDLGYSAGSYYFRSGLMSSAVLLEYQPNYYDSKPFCCVFRSPYRSTATTNQIGLNIPMAGLLVQRDTLDIRAAVYWSAPITYNAVGGSGNNTADSGYSPRRVILGGAGGHGIYATNQSQCNWPSATGAIGAGWDGVDCGSFPNNLVWGTGRSDTAVYENRSGTWSHWVNWNY